MENWYKFTAYNSEARYGFGTEAEASAYAEYLNRDREINCYAPHVVAGAELIHALENDRDDGVNIDDELREIAANA